MSLFKKITKITKKVISNPTDLINDIKNDFSKALTTISNIISDKKITDDEIIEICSELIQNSLAKKNNAEIKKVFGLLAKHTSAEKEVVTNLMVSLKNNLPVSDFQTVSNLFFDTFPNAFKIFTILFQKISASANDILDEVDTLFSPLLVAAINHNEQTAKAVADILMDVLVAQHKNIQRFSADSVLKSISNQGFSKLLFSQESFRLSKPTWIVTLFLDRLFSSVELLTEGQNTLNKLPILNQVFKNENRLHKLSIAIKERLALLFVHRFIERARHDKDVEWQLLQIARFIPVGVVLIVIATLVCATDVKGITSDKGFFLDLIGKDIEAANSGYKVKRLPQKIVKERHGKVIVEKIKHKYLVLSDIHRDDQSDKRPRFEKGSVDHFMRNAALYLRVLDYADKNNYTVIEAGDCEELWFHNDFSKRPTEKLKGVINTHRKVYNKLKKLHKQKRYFRTFGNHDSYLRDAETRKVIDDFFGSDFEIYDFIIIDGVKTMQAPFDDIRIGLDSAPYTERAPMIITHGHHWDFWNCDRNNILGKLIVSAVGTPIDMIDDIFQDIGGLTRQGSPLYNFKAKMSNLHIFNNWPTKNVAKRWSYNIAHQSDQGRRLNDSIFYFETLTALLSYTIKVKKTSEESDALFCMGHTHAPQAQPYLDIFDFLPNVVKTGVNTIVKGISGGLVNTDAFLYKTNFFNSGVAGWNDGIVWAVDIGEYGGNTGQPKLIFWDEDNTENGAQTMHWELPYMDDQHRKELHEQPIVEWLNLLKELPSEISGKLKETAAIAMPFGGLIKEADNFKNDVLSLDEWSSVTDKIKGIQTQFVKTLMSFLNGDTKEFAITHKLNNSIAAKIQHTKSLLNVFPLVSSDTIDMVTMVWLFMENNAELLLGKNQEKAASEQIFSILSFLAFIFPEQSALPIQSKTSIRNGKITLTLKTQGTTKKPSTSQRELSIRQKIKRRTGTVNVRSEVTKGKSSLREALKTM